MVVNILWLQFLRIIKYRILNRQDQLCLLLFGSHFRCYNCSVTLGWKGYLHKYIQKRVFESKKEKYKPTFHLILNYLWPHWIWCVSVCKHPNLSLSNIFCRYFLRRKLWNLTWLSYSNSFSFVGSMPVVTVLWAGQPSLYVITTLML